MPNPHVEPRNSFSAPMENMPELENWVMNLIVFPHYSSFLDESRFGSKIMSASESHRTEFGDFFQRKNSVPPPNDLKTVLKIKPEPPTISNLSSDEKILRQISGQQVILKSSSETQDILEWDFFIPTPPPRRSGTIKVKLRFRAKTKPILTQDPWA
jgi:hypothetical protein